MERHQWQRLAQLVAGPPEHLAADLRYLAAAARARADLLMPGSPSMSTKPPHPRAASLISPLSSAISLSRPISALAGVSGCMEQTLLPEHLPNKQSIFGRQFGDDAACGKYRLTFP